MRETTFGVELHEGDRCFVLYQDIPPALGTIRTITWETATVVLDTGETMACAEERLTLSFKLLGENNERKGKK